MDQAVPFPDFMALADPRRQLSVGVRYRGLVISSREVSHAEYIISVSKKLRAIYAPSFKPSSFCSHSPQSSILDKNDRQKMQATGELSARFREEALIEPQL